MFSPNSKSLTQNTSFGRSPVAVASKSNLRRKSSLYATKSRSFFTPQGTGRNRNQNSTELPLTLEDVQPSEHQLSTFEGHIPISVSEILLGLEGIPPRAKINKDGYAWLLSKDKLILWNIVSPKTGVCCELNLPYGSTDEEGVDDLIYVATLDLNESNSCLMVTSEGSVTYWSSVSYPRSFVDMKISSGRGPSDLCIDVVVVAGGFLIGWLSGALTFLQPFQGQLKQTTLRPQQGGLTGIGRRFSSMIFGAGQRSSSVNQVGSLRRILPGNFLDTNLQEAYALTETHLQKWVISSTSSEKMLYEINVEAIIASCLNDTHGLHPGPITLHDIQLTSEGVVILFSTSSKMACKCGIAILLTSPEEAPTSVHKLALSEYSCPQHIDGSPKSFNLLWPNPTSLTNGFFYNKDTIVCFKDLEDGSSISESVNFPNVGAGCYEGLPIFLSIEGFLIKVQETVVATNRSMADSLMKNKTFSSVNTTVTPAEAFQERLGELSQSHDPLTKFKAIFISSMYHGSHSQFNKTTTMLSELFTLSSDRDPKLDSLVIKLSQEMTDDHPASDPRWVGSNSSDISVVPTSMILTHQLNDKLKAHEAFINFLKVNNLWEKLGTVLEKNGYVPTCRVLAEHAEKLVAAAALRELHVQCTEVVDEAIEKCVSKRQSLAHIGSLKPQDLFYREVSKIQEIFESLVSVERSHLDVINLENNPEGVQLVSSVGAIFKEVLGRALMYRKAKMDVYRNSNYDPDRKRSDVHKMSAPWTAADIVLGPLLRQHNILANQVIPLVGEASQRNSLFQDMLEVTDLALDGLTDILKLQRDETVRRYEQTRSDLFAPFVQYEQFERVMSLAEKYCDYQLLVQLCDCLSDEARLDEYMARFDGQGFSEVVFNWYCKTGKRGHLFRPRMMEHPRLEEFLRRKENKFMSWLYDIKKKNHLAAHETLFELAMEEKNSVTKKRTLLSQAKLQAFLVKDPPTYLEDRVEVINNNLELISHQEVLFKNPSILEYLTIEDFSSSRVFTPLELIDLHIGPCNQNADEYEFKKAYDLLKFCDANDEDHSFSEILVDIWVKAILRDDWDFPLSTTDPVAGCRHTVFFKFLELVLSEVSEIDEVLPQAEDLLASEDLSPFSGDDGFKFKLMVIYEHARRMIM